MKHILILLICLLLAGCYSTTPAYKINNAIEICKDRGGVFLIDNDVIAGHVKCNDGSFHNFTYGLKK
jgi:hypothetical protein